MATTASTPDTQGGRTRNIGRIEQVTGVVIEASFPEGNLPEIYNALEEEEDEDDEDQGDQEQQASWLYEPEPEEILARLIPDYVR